MPELATIQTPDLQALVGGPYTRSHIAQSLITLNGVPYSLRDYPFLRSVYDTGAPEILFKTGRQVTKSTCAACIMTIDSIARRFFKSLYVAPLQEQTSRFSRTRLSHIMKWSPLIRDIFLRSGKDRNSTDNVFLRLLSNGSEITLSYAWDDPDRIRSISADRIVLDEVQDMLYDNVIPVIKECMGNSDFGYSLYAGTPKSMENTIEYLWQRSTKSEWIMRCSGCNKWQYIESRKSMGKHGVICVKCGKQLNVRDGQWYDFAPSAPLRGFHVSQPMLPRNNEVPNRWRRLLEKMENYGSTRFKNEVMGISDAIGSRFIGEEELLALCEDYFVELPLSRKLTTDVHTVVGGVDWAGNGEGFKSRTVAWVFGITGDFKLKTLYFKIFPYANSIQTVDEVAEIFDACNCRLVVGDSGEGAVANSELRAKLGPHRVEQAQFGGGSGFGKLVSWSKDASKYLVNRTAAIDSYMHRLKKQAVIFPNARQTAIPISDILNEYEETIRNPQGGGEKKAWRHAPDAPDDCLMAQIFAWIASKVVLGDLKMYDETEFEDYV